MSEKLKACPHCGEDGEGLTATEGIRNIPPRYGCCGCGIYAKSARSWNQRAAVAFDMTTWMIGIERRMAKLEESMEDRLNQELTERVERSERD